MLFNLKDTDRIITLKGEPDKHYRLARRGPGNSRVEAVDLDAGKVTGPDRLVKNTDIESVVSYGEIKFGEIFEDDEPAPSAPVCQIPVEKVVYDKLTSLAEKSNETVNDLLKRFLKLA